MEPKEPRQKPKLNIDEREAELLESQLKATSPDPGPGSVINATPLNVGGKVKRVRPWDDSQNEDDRWR